MYVQVRMMGTGKSFTIPTSRCTNIMEFKNLVEEKVNIQPENQRLFFGGKQVRTTIFCYVFFPYLILPTVISICPESLVLLLWQLYQVLI